MRLVGHGLALGLLLAGFLGCANAYRDLTDKSKDSYVIDRARQSLDQLDFDAAIDQIDPIRLRRPQDPEVAYIASAAYAGRAGLRILDLFMALAQELGEKKLFEIFAEHYPGATEADVVDMEKAVQILEDYAPAATGRTPEINFYALFLYYSRIGIQLNRHAFIGSSKRANFSVCHTESDPAGPVTGLPHATVDVVMTTIPRIVETIPHVGADSGIAAGALDTSLFDSFPRSPYPCESFSNLLDPSPATLQCLAVRQLIGGTALGLSTGDAPTCGTGYTP